MRLNCLLRIVSASFACGATLAALLVKLRHKTLLRKVIRASRSG
jgi:hypothetical protein